MKKIVNYSNILKINFLGYNFADWVTMFKKKYKQKDGTYDFMSYLFDQENKAAYYIMRANLGIFANIYLNMRYASMMNDIDVVGGSKEEQTGGSQLGFLLALIGVYFLFMMSIDTKETLAQKFVEKLKKDNPNIKISNNQIQLAEFLAINGNINGKMGSQDMLLQYRNVLFLDKVVLQGRPMTPVDRLWVKNNEWVLHKPGESWDVTTVKTLAQLTSGVTGYIAQNAANHIDKITNELPNDDKEKLKVEVGNGGVGQMFVDISLKDLNEGDQNANDDTYLQLLYDSYDLGGQKKSRKIKKNKKSRRK